MDSSKIKIFSQHEPFLITNIAIYYEKYWIKPKKKQRKIFIKSLHLHVSDVPKVVTCSGSTWPTHIWQCTYEIEWNMELYILILRTSRIKYSYSATFWSVSHRPPSKTELYLFTFFHFRIFSLQRHYFQQIFRFIPKIIIKS